MGEVWSSGYTITYRSSPHTTTGVTPASLFLNRSLRTKFDMLKPSVESHVLEKQSSQKIAHDRRAKERGWSVGQTVLARCYRPGPAWVSATIVEKLGPVTYTVETGNHQQWKRHAEQLKAFVFQRDSAEHGPAHLMTFWGPPPEVDEAPPTREDTPPPNVRGVPVLIPPVPPSPPSTRMSGGLAGQTDNATTQPRYPVRVRKPREHYQ